MHGVFGSPTGSGGSPRWIDILWSQSIKEVGTRQPAAAPHTTPPYIAFVHPIDDEK